MNGPWNQLDQLLIGFNSINFPALWAPTWQLSLTLLVLGIIFYNFQGRRLRAYSVFLDLNEWLMWTSIGVFGLLVMFFVFAFDFQFALPAEFPGGLLDLTLYFVKRTFRLVLRAGFHCNTPSPRVTAVFD